MVHLDVKQNLTNTAVGNLRWWIIFRAQSIGSVWFCRNYTQYCSLLKNNFTCSHLLASTQWFTSVRVTMQTMHKNENKLGILSWSRCSRSMTFGPECSTFQYILLTIWHTCRRIKFWSICILVSFLGAAKPSKAHHHSHAGIDILFLIISDIILQGSLHLTKMRPHRSSSKSSNSQQESTLSRMGKYPISGWLNLCHS